MKRKLIHLTIALAMVTGLFGFAPIHTNADDADWIAVSDSAGLVAVANNLSGRYYLTADIDLTGTDWVPIGNDEGR